MLCDTTLLLQRTDFTVEEEAKKAIGRLKFAVMLFENYQLSEDNYVLPSITTYEPGIADSFEQEHKEVHRLGSTLQSLLTGYRKLSLPLEKERMREEIIARFEEFTLFNLLRFIREEQVINHILWRYYTDAELQEISWRMISKSGPALQTSYIEWIFRGMNNNESRQWIKEVQSITVEDEFYNLLKMAEAKLHPRRWSLLQDALCTGVLVD